MKNILFGLLFIFTTLAAAENITHVQFNTHGSRLIVKLPANPTTGFRWKAAEYNHKIFNLTEAKYHALPSNKIGAGGEMVFVFRYTPSAAKATEIKFEYSRPWSTKDASLRTFKIDLK